METAITLHVFKTKCGRKLYLNIKKCNEFELADAAQKGN
jgi:hypothetical protein